MANVPPSPPPPPTPPPPPSRQPLSPGRDPHWVNPPAQYSPGSPPSPQPLLSSRRSDLSSLIFIGLGIGTFLGLILLAVLIITRDTSSPVSPDPSMAENKAPAEKKEVIASSRQTSTGASATPALSGTESPANVSTPPSAAATQKVSPALPVVQVPSVVVPSPPLAETTVPDTKKNTGVKSKDDSKKIAAAESDSTKDDDNPFVVEDVPAKAKTPPDTIAKSVPKEKVKTTPDTDVSENPFEEDAKTVDADKQDDDGGIGKEEAMASEDSKESLPDDESSVTSPGRSPKLTYAWEKGKRYNFSYEAEWTLKNKADKSTKVSKTGGAVAFQPVQQSLKDLVREEESGGTAFVVNSDGVLATCYHVIRGAKRISVKFDKKSYPATVIGTDKIADIALLKIKATDLHALPLGDSSEAEMGEDVNVIGYPLTDILGSSVKVVSGMINGTVKTGKENSLQIDAAINPGNSGGPALDSSGRVIGIAKAMLAGSSINKVGLIVPVNQVAALMKANKIAGNGVTKSAEMKTTELVKATVPSVGLVRVVSTTGGVDQKTARVLQYATANLTDSRKSSIKEHWMDSHPGIIAADAYGNVVLDRKEIDAPFVFFGPARVAIETLADDNSNAWTVRRDLVLTLSKDVLEGESLPNIPGFQSPNSPGDTPFTGEKTIVRSYMVVPVEEAIRYKWSAKKGDVHTFTRSYEMRIGGGGLDSPLVVTGQGVMKWDAEKHMPVSVTFKGAANFKGKGESLRIPLTMVCTGQVEVAL